MKSSSSVPSVLLKPIVIACTVALTGCASMQQATQMVKDNAAVAGGAMIGAVAGATACAINGSKNVALCAVGGALAGAAIGKVWDYRQKALAEAAKKHELEIQTQEVKTNNQRYVAVNSDGKSPAKKEGNAMSAVIKDSGMFASGSSRLNPSSREVLLDVAKAYANENKKILVIGHTDSSGSAELNQRLSEKRARAVSKVFIEAGIPEADIYFQGAGESRPMVANNTVEGRKKNRRVEIVEADSEASIVAYDVAKTTSQDNLRFADNDSKKATVKPKTVIKPQIDFGGALAKSSDLSFYEDLGSAPSRMPSLFSKAHADLDSPAPQACYLDAPRVKGAIKKANGSDLDAEQYKIREYVPGLAKSALFAKVNDHTVGLAPVAVLRSDYTATNSPELRLNTAEGLKKYKTVVNTYEGEESFLYRVFTVSKAAPVTCIDLVYPKNGGKQATAGALYYQAGGVYASEFQPMKLAQR